MTSLTLITLEMGDVSDLSPDPNTISTDRRGRPAEPGAGRLETWAYGSPYIGLGSLNVRRAKPPARSLFWSPMLSTTLRPPR